MTWDSNIGTISQLAQQIPGGWVSVSGHAGVSQPPLRWPFTQGRGHMGPGAFFPSKGARLAFPSAEGVVQEILQESRKTKGMALKIIQGSKKNHGIIHQDCCSS